MRLIPRNVTDLKLVHPWKDPVPSISRPAGNVTAVSALHAKKALSLIDVRTLPWKVTDVKLTQPRKASSSMDSRLAGSVMDANHRQSLKVSARIVVPSVIVRAVGPVGGDRPAMELDGTVRLMFAICFLVIPHASLDHL